jgi:HD-GYP domain-containing protein (c-di-GMP phosphodiesterase class II)
VLHDIGLSSISENIVNKEGELNYEEIATLRTHAAMGKELVGCMQRLNRVAQIISQHHERPDGKGYPEGLTNGKIAREAKIIALAEAYASMTSPDSYKKPLSNKEACEEIRRHIGTQFDPDIAAAFLKKYEKV